MKKALILLFFVPIFSFGQSKFTSSLHLGLKAGIITLPSFSSFGADAISQESKPNIGYSFGLTGSYFFRSRYFLRSGLGFEHSRFLVETEGFTFSACFDPTSGIVTEATHYEYPSMRSVFVPFDYGWRIGDDDDDLKIFMGIGVQLNFLIKKEVKERIEKEGQETITVRREDFDINPLSARIFFNIEYIFASKPLIFEPMLKVASNDFDLSSSGWVYSIIEPGVTVRIGL